MGFKTITREDGVALAYEFLPGRAPVVVFLPGFGSDMGGTKAMALRAACAARGQAMLRLDYSGNGASGGRFEDGTIGGWTRDAALVMETAAPDTPLLLVGSSMGGWIALLLALQRGGRVAGLVLVAPAADFTEDIFANRLSADQRAALDRDGHWRPPAGDGPPLTITRQLIDEGRRHLLLAGTIAIAAPVRVLHGMRDDSVPWAQSLKLSACLASDDVQLLFVKDGDHRLSRDADIRLLIQSVFTLLGQNAG